MRRVLLCALCALPTFAAGEVRFYEPSWAGASGQDGKGGVVLPS